MTPNVGRGDNGRAGRGRHVVLLTSTFPPERTPAAKRMLALGLALVDAGHRVSAVCPAPHYPGIEVYRGFGRTWMDRRFEDGLTVTRIRPRMAPRTKVLRRSIGEGINAFAQFLVLLGETPDVIVATIPSLALGPVGAFAAATARARFVLDVRDLYWLYAMQLGKVPKAAARATEWAIASIAGRADAVTTTTQHQLEYLCRLAPSLRRTGQVVPNGVDDEFYHAFEAAAPGPVDRRQGRLRLAYAGLLGYAQGIGVLIEAAALLDPRKWEVVIAGDGPERQALEARAVALGLSHVTFTGYVGAEALVQVYASADVLYAQLRDLPVMATAQPSKVLDYMATGRPIIYGGTGAGAALVQDAGAGVVIPADDPRAIVGALAALASEEQRSRMGRAGRDHVGRRLLRSGTLGRFVDVVTGGSGLAARVP